MRSSLVCAAALLAACYHPAAQTGLPCSDPGHTCPGDQVCDESQVPPVCVDEQGPMPDGALEVDAPPVIPCSDGCPTNQPVCDTATSTCRGCIADSECPGACYEMMGTCTTDAETLFVAPGGSDLGMCTRATPCGSPGYAVQIATATRHHVRVENGTYTTGFLLRSDAVISGPDVDASGVMFRPMGGGGSQGGVSSDPGIAIVLEGVTIMASNNDGFVNRGTLTASHVVISEAGRNGIDNRGGMITVHDSRIERCTNAGINGGGAAVELERSMVVDNRGTGVIATSGYSIINTVIANNGTSNPSYGGAHLGAGGTAPTVFRFNTVVGNKSLSGGIAGVQCDSALVLEDSIFSDTISVLSTELGAPCTARYSLFESNAPMGTGNVTGAPMLVNAASDFHLQPGSPAIDQADPMATDTSDFENGVRPTGAARDIGADERP